MDAKEILDNLTLEEKASLCSGRDFWGTRDIPRVGLPSVLMTDGPHGLRVQKGAHDHLGVHDSETATCFPLACATGSSFDKALLRELGAAMGEEAQALNVGVVLGPGANIKRSPLCGRNFEYFSEDPYVTGELASAHITGLQSKGVGASLKHFAVNSQERARLVNDSIVDERAMREIYLSGFEKAVKSAQPWTVMCSYNQVNGTFVSVNKRLLTDILRTEWGFDGVVVTDWGAVNDRVQGIEAGLDLDMPHLDDLNAQEIIAAVKNGRLPMAALDISALRMIELVMKCQRQHRAVTVDFEAHHALARKLAAQSAVLLKNENETLPLQKNQRVAVIGQFAKQPRYQGAGSSRINPYRVDVPLEELERLGLQATYADGYDLSSAEADPAMIAQAAELARQNDCAVVFIGLPPEYESEGFDRQSLNLPEAHHKLVEAVAEANPNTIAVLMCGAPV